MAQPWDKLPDQIIFTNIRGGGAKKNTPSKWQTKFPAFLTNFSDDYVSNWSSNDVYGRMDPVFVFQNTQRVLSFSFTSPASDLAEAKKIMANASSLIRFLYPSYDKGSGPNNINKSITTAPLMRIKFANLIQNNKTKGGLLGFLSGFSFTPNLDGGMFGDDNAGKRSWYPKNLDVTCEFRVIHEHDLGYHNDLKGGHTTMSGFTGFPYGTKSASAEKGSKNNKKANTASATKTPKPKNIQAAQNQITDPNKGNA